MTHAELVECLTCISRHLLCNELTPAMIVLDDVRRRLSPATMEAPKPRALRRSASIDWTDLESVIAGHPYLGNKGPGSWFRRDMEARWSRMSLHRFRVEVEEEMKRQDAVMRKWEKRWGVSRTEPCPVRTIDLPAAGPARRAA